MAHAIDVAVAMATMRPRIGHPPIGVIARIASDVAAVPTIVSSADRARLARTESPQRTQKQPTRRAKRGSLANRGESAATAKHRVPKAEPVTSAKTARLPISNKASAGRDVIEHRLRATRTAAIDGPSRLRRA